MAACTQFDSIYTRFTQNLYNLIERGRATALNLIYRGVIL